MVGNCGCKICGLRGHSKNVMTRNVFPVFPKDDYVLEAFESNITAEYNQSAKQYLFGSKRKVYDAAKHEFTDEIMSLADLLIDYVKRCGGDIENIRILLCVHDWVQDPGTETV
jgi:hypothetical protein